MNTLLMREVEILLLHLFFLGLRFCRGGNESNLFNPTYEWWAKPPHC